MTAEYAIAMSGKLAVMADGAEHGTMVMASHMAP